ncbi:helix-turn-helix domain-containing protein [Propioniciclava flava]
MTMSAAGVKPEFVSLQEAAVLYSVSVDLLRQRIAAGELPAVHAGRRLIRVRLEDLKRVFRPLGVHQVTAARVMSSPTATTETPPRDRPLVLYDLLEQIAWLQVVGADPAEIEELAEEYRRLRAEL